MTGFAVIGDEVTCAGFRLAGARTWTPKPDEVPDLVRQALGEATVIVLTAEFARHLPPKELRALLARTMPAVIVIPDIRERESPPDLAGQVFANLGIAR